MNSFQFFDANDYEIVLLMLFFSSYFLMQLLKKIKKQIAGNQIDSVKRKGLVFILIGDLCVVISVVGFVLIEKDYERVIGIFRPISIMTSEPIVILLIAFLFVGIVLEISGIYSFKRDFQK